jgi:hypothetical protein
VVFRDQVAMNAARHVPHLLNLHHAAMHGDEERGLCGALQDDAEAAARRGCD